MKSLFVVVAALVVLCCRECRAFSFTNTHTATEESDEVVLEKWIDADHKIRELLKSVVSRVLPILIRSSAEVDISPECSASILRLVYGIRDAKKSPFLMVDASGKLISGSLSGSGSALGSYEQCVNIADYDELSGELLLQGKYCLVNTRFPLPKMPRLLSFYETLPALKNFTTDNFMMQRAKENAYIFYSLPFRRGFCVPSTCQREDVQNIAQYVFKRAGLIASVSHCEVKETVKVDTAQIVILSVIGIFVLFCLIGSGLDTITRMSNGKEVKINDTSEATYKRILVCFSVTRNLKRLLNVEETGDRKLRFLHGIRFLTLCWVILQHSYTSVSGNLINNFHYVRSMLLRTSFQVIANTFLSVDTFFFISGLLVAYLCVQRVDSRGGKGFNVPLLIFHRFYRLVPSTMMVIACTLLVPLVGSGPVWHEEIDPIVQTCRKAWWTNMIFISNFIDLQKMCLVHTWYISVDVQLFIVAIFYLFILFKNVKLGIAFNLTMVLTSVILTAAINYWKDLPPIPLATFPNTKDLIYMFDLTHTKPHTHLGVYFVGLGLGTYLARKKDTKLHPIIHVVLWCATTVLMATLVFVSREWNAGAVASPAFSAFYAGVHRLGWVLGLSWITYACFTGYGGIVQSFLSWSGFIPLSRLTFLAYLWHFLIITTYYGFWRVPIEAHNVFAVWLFLGNLMVSYGVALIANLLYDAPIGQLEKVLLGGLVKTMDQAEEDHEQKKIVTIFHGNSELPSVELNGSYSIKKEILK